MSEMVDIHMGEAGRLVIPAAFRKTLGLKKGTRLVARLDEDGIRILTPKMALERLQKLAEERIPAHKRGKIVDEFIAERHAEAAKE